MSNKGPLRALAMGDRGGIPTRVADAIRSFLSQRGMGARIEQAEIVREWPEIVGSQIASVTAAHGVTQDGTLLVRVRTNAWMTELSLREPEIVAAIRAKLPGVELTRIRWQLWRD